MKALIIEDDEKNGKLLVELLKIKNIEAAVARSGSEGIGLMSPQYAFYVVDLRLPDINGYEVAGRIKGKYPKTPVLAYTASAPKDERNRLGNNKLFDGVIAKPINLKNFDEVIAACIGNKN